MTSTDLARIRKVVRVIERAEKAEAENVKLRYLIKDRDQEVHNALAALDAAKGE